MPRGHRWSGTLSRRAAALIFGDVGVLLLGLAVQQAYQLHVKLTT